MISGLSAPPIHSSKNLVFSGGPVKSLGLQLSMFQEQIRMLTWLWDEYSASRSSRRVSAGLIRQHTGLLAEARGLTDPVGAEEAVPSVELVARPCPHGEPSSLAGHSAGFHTKVTQRTSSTESLSTLICCIGASLNKPRSKPANRIEEEHSRMRHPHVHRHPGHRPDLINTHHAGPIPGPKPLADAFEREHVRTRDLEHGFARQRVPGEDGYVPAFVREEYFPARGGEDGERGDGARPFRGTCRPATCCCRRSDGGGGGGSGGGPDPERLVHAYRRSPQGRVRRTPRRRAGSRPQLIAEHPDEIRTFPYPERPRRRHFAVRCGAHGEDV